ncbi:hypothetical protein [Jatrophihabitans fulvus]
MTNTSDLVLLATRPHYYHHNTSHGHGSLSAGAVIAIIVVAVLVLGGYYLYKNMSGSNN